MNNLTLLAIPAKADPGFTIEEMKTFVRKHFDDFVNKQLSDVALKNFSSDFLDHDGPTGPVIGPEAARKMMESAYKLLPNLRVEVLEIMAEHDKVMVRNRWTATNAGSGRKVEFHGFVLWRFAHQKIVERWATLTEPEEIL